MKKRAIFILLSLIGVFSMLGLRLNSISRGGYALAGSSSASRTVEVADIRGTVFDCKLHPLVNCETAYTAAVRPTPSALAALGTALNQTELEAIEERLKKGKPLITELPSDFPESDDITVIRRKKRYGSRVLAQHIIGYTDSAGNGVCGIEKSFNALLESGSVRVKARFSTDAFGRVLLGEKIQVFNNNYEQKSGVVLTVDKKIQQLAEDSMDLLGIDKGAVVVMDVKTGAIRACASRPVYDPNKLAESLNSADSPFINRAFLAYSVGSAFKPVVAAAALESGINRQFKASCTGSVTINGNAFHCHKEEGHGALDMNGGVANSCNVYFIRLAEQTGREALIETATKLGFGQSTVFADGLACAAGNLPEAAELDSAASVANLSFGQGALLATPVQIAAMMAAIANDGIYHEPYLIEGTTNSKGDFTEYSSHGNQHRAISSGTARLLRGFLVSVVNDGTGKRAATPLMQCAGKTATAQTGRSTQDGEICNAWFAGYFPADKPQYSVAVFKEDGGEGAISCAPVFKSIAEGMFRAGYIENEE